MKRNKKKSDFLSASETAIIGAQIILNEKQTIEIECQKKLIKCKTKHYLCYLGNYLKIL